jgi:hypothetical protein
MRIGDDAVGMSGTLLSVSSEKLRFPGQGDSAATAMLKNDTCNASGGLARPGRIAAVYLFFDKLP